MIDMFYCSKPNSTTEWLPLPKESSAPWIQLHISSPKAIYVEEIKGNLAKRSFWKSLGFEENEKLLNLHDEL